MGEDRLSRAYQLAKNKEKAVAVCDIVMSLTDDMDVACAAMLNEETNWLAIEASSA